MTTISVDQLEEFDWSIYVPSKDRDTTEKTLDELLNILDAADKFGRVDLHSKVQRHIMLHGEEFIYEKNALEIQNIANEINATLLESYCDKSLNPIGLMTMPMEMRMNIFRFCTVTSVIRVLRTCKYLNNEINSYWWKSQLNTRFNPSDWPLTYKAVKNIWGLSQDVSKIGYASSMMRDLCGIPGFFTVDTPSDEPFIPSGQAVFYPHINAPDPFIQGILTDGQHILVGYLRSSGSVALAMLDCTTNPLRIAKFKPSTLIDCGWPRDITNAALHSGLVLLQHGGSIDLFSVKYDQQAPKRVRTFNYFASAMSINRNYYFFCVGSSVLMFDRDSHSLIMDLTGMRSPAVDLIIRNDKVMALTESKVCIWDISSHKAPSLKILTQPEGRCCPLIIGHDHDSLGWARRKEIISNSDTSGLVLAGYCGLYASFGEFKHLDSINVNERETIMQLDMEGRFIGKVCLANPNLTIQNAKTLDTIKDAINLRNQRLGTFLGFTLNSRVIVCFFTSGIQMISSTPRDGEIQRAVDDVFLNNSSSRISRVKFPAWPEAY